MKPSIVAIIGSIIPELGHAADPELATARGHRHSGFLGMDRSS
jgi:hypothetical protein